MLGWGCGRGAAAFVSQFELRRARVRRWLEVREENAGCLGLEKPISDTTYWNRMHTVGIESCPFRSVPAQEDGDPAARVEFCTKILEDARQWWEDNKAAICPKGSEVPEGRQRRKPEAELDS